MTQAVQSILACIDGSPLSQSVIEYAIWLAKSSQTPITFLHAIEHSYKSKHIHREGNLTPNVKEQLLDELSDEERQESKRLITQGKHILETALQMAEKEGLTDIICKQRHGSLAETLADLKFEYSLVVLGIKGEDHSNDKQGLGTQIEDAIRAIHVPVFIVKTAFSIPETLMLAYNGSPTSKKAVQSVSLPPFSQMVLHIVSVDNKESEAQRYVDEARKMIKKHHQSSVSNALAGEPLDTLICYQKQHDIDVIAMGAFSHGKLHGFFFGSFTTRMLLESSANFLLVR